MPGTPVPMHRWVGSGGLTIAGDSWGGTNDGPLVMLLHGGGQTRHAWKGAGEILGRAGYRAVAFDARGHGDSEWAAASDYGPDHMIRDLGCVVAAIGGNRPVLVGASMGGGTSLMAIGEAHIEASALVLVDMAPRIEAEGTAKIQAFMYQKPEGFDSLEEVAEAIAGYQPHRPRPRSLDGLAKNLRLGANGKYRWHWDPARRQSQTTTDERRDRMSRSADRLEVPTLLVRGGLSDVLSEAGAQSFLEQCPHAEYVNVADAAHMVAGDRNDIFADAVIEFLGRVVPAAAG